jgi:hypothetical protein
LSLNRLSSELVTEPAPVKGAYREPGQRRTAESPVCRPYAEASIEDRDDPYGIVATLTQAIAEGSYLAIGHLTADIYPELADFARALNERQLDSMLVLRDHAQVTAFFDGLELVDPGVVQLSKWRPQSEAEAAAAAALWGGAARKPG